MATAYIEIGLTQGKITLIDLDDYNIVVRSNWFADKNRTKNWYAKRKGYTSKGTRITYSLQNFLLGTINVDHKNGNGLDNRRSNLRLSTQQQNSYNTKKKSGMSSKYKGVCWNKEYNNWRVYITVQRCRIHIGYYKDEITAALAYDKEARKYHGSFACVNFPIGSERGAVI